MLNSLIARLAMALLLACAALPAYAEAYRVSIDTSTLAGQDGYLDFLLLGLSGAAPLQAKVSNFSGDFAGDAFKLGDVTGALNTHVAIGNSAGWNEFGQWTHFGGTLSFEVSFDNAATSGAGTTLSIALLDTDLNYLGAGGDVATFALLPGGVPAIGTDHAYATVTAVPEPAAYLLFSAGLLLAGLRMRGRRSI